MRIHTQRTILGLAAGAVLAPAARGQLVRPRRAFEPVVTASIGSSFFGNRASLAGDATKYSDGATIGVGLDVPFRRRTGFMLRGSVTPFSKQVLRTGANTVTQASVVIYRADAALAFRFKPAAPIYFYAGGGIVGANKYSLPTSTGSPLDPEGLVGLGYDTRFGQRVGLRIDWSAHIVAPSAPGTPASEPQWTAPGHAFDWSLLLGLRYALHATP